MTGRPPLPYDEKEIRRRLQAALPSLLGKLGIKERVRAPLMYPLNLWRRGSKPDRTPGSFVIWTSGDAAGAWRDYACPADVAGDVYDLIVYTLRLKGWIDAYWWALDFLNLQREGGAVRGAAQAELDRQRAEQDRRDAEAATSAADAEKSAALFAGWLKLAPIAGTVAETYLREARKIPLERLAHMPGALRFDPALEHFDEETGEFTVWPGMVAARTRGSKVVGVHRTWLAADGSGKAPLAKAKKMAGRGQGSAIRLTAGPSNLSPAKALEAGKYGPLAVGEGIETCLTVACARLDLRVWAAGAISFMGLLTWPDCANAVVLLGENDWKPQARRAFAAVEAHWRAQAKGRPVHVAASEVGSDFNDWARGAAA